MDFFQIIEKKKKKYLGSIEKTTDKRTVNKYPTKSVVTGDL